MTQRFDHEGAVAKKRKETRRAIRIRVGLFFLVAAIAGLVFIFVHPKMYVTNVMTHGFGVSDESAVRQAVTDYLDTKVLGVIPRRHRFFVDAPKLKQMLKSNYPVFQSISIAIESQTLSLTVGEERAPYLWCESQIAESTFPACAYLSTSGKLIEEAPYVSETAKLLFVTEAKNIGDVAIAPEVLKKAIGYRDELLDLGFETRQIAIGIADIELKGKFDKNSAPVTVVYAPIQEDPKTVAAYAAVLMRDEVFKQSFTTKKLEYIDARFGKILYYRFQ